MPDLYIHNMLLCGLHWNLGIVLALLFTFLILCISAIMYCVLQGIPIIKSDILSSGPIYLCNKHSKTAIFLSIGHILMFTSEMALIDSVIPRYSIDAFIHHKSIAYCVVITQSVQF